ncbi:MAG TPA: hypothetical protein VMS78_14075 [Rhizomicrobium sp.]|nr:hypothetical protein [Rhizomicrobium sp.]
MKTQILTELRERNAVPTRSFSFPHEVVDDPSLSTAEKRSILSEWASDACAVQSFPTLRWLPGTTFPVTFSAIMDARQQLDRKLQQVEQEEPEALRRVVIADFMRKKSGSQLRN